jgi:uncharacterized membrane protein YdbT with pleckstrin-like domain
MAVRWKSLASARTVPQLRASYGINARGAVDESGWPTGAAGAPNGRVRTAMRYVRRVLLPGEAVAYYSRLHWIIFTRAILAAIICLGLVIAALYETGSPTRSLSLALWIAAAIFAVLALSAGLRALVRRASTEFAVTDQRVIYKTGLLGRHTLEMNRSKVESVDVDQSILGRLLNYGTIIVRGTGGSLEPIRQVAAPLTFRGYITAAAQPR